MISNHNTFSNLVVAQALSHQKQRARPSPGGRVGAATRYLSTALNPSGSPLTHLCDRELPSHGI